MSMSNISFNSFGYFWNYVIKSVNRGKDPSRYFFLWTAIWNRTDFIAIYRDMDEKKPDSSSKMIY